MTPEEFRAKWQGVTAGERQAAQSHFEDLCRLLTVQTPLEANLSGTWYAYEKNILKLDGRPGARRRLAKRLLRLGIQGPQEESYGRLQPAQENTPTRWRTRRCSSSPTCGKSASTPTLPIRLLRHRSSDSPTSTRSRFGRSSDGRTLTNLYNARPAWLDNIHRELDEAVAAAYGWPTGLSDDEILKRLLDLNLARAAANPSPQPSPGGRGRA